MPNQRQLDERISSWLEAEAPDRVPDRTLTATFDRTRRLKQHGRWRAVLGRMINVNRTLMSVAAVAVVAVAVVGGLSFAGMGTGPGGQPAPSAAPSLSTAPSASATPAPTPTPVPGLAMGPHQLWDRGVPMVATIAAPGWFGDANDGILIKDDDSQGPDGAGLIVFAGDPGGLYVYADPCSWSDTRPATPAGTVEAVVEALSAQAGRDASEPVAVTIGGHTGQSITLHVPEDADFQACDSGQFASWGVEGEDPARYHQDPGQIDELWILDVEGELVILDAGYYEGTPPAVVEELRTLAKTITFGPGS